MSANWQEEQIETLDDIAIEDILSNAYELVIYNDDVNTFDHVIETLIEVCGHTYQQAEQCTLIIHYRGKCTVKRGDFNTLAAMRNDICRRGISAEVE
jgi:ATP-dependent Clp protease adaptor protein ClpS